MGPCSTSLVCGERGFPDGSASDAAKGADDEGEVAGDDHAACDQELRIQASLPRFILGVNR